MDVAQFGRLVRVFTMGVLALTLTMQAMVTSRERTFIRFSSRPFRQLSSVLLDAERRSNEINILSARGRITTGLFNGRVIMRANTCATSVRDSN